MTRQLGGRDVQARREFVLLALGQGDVDTQAQEPGSWALQGHQVVVPGQPNHQTPPAHHWEMSP